MKRLVLANSMARTIYRKWWERKYGVSRDDVFLVSYPRSGNTWVRFMLLQARPDFSENDFSRIEEIIPDMHGPSSWHKCARTSVVKSHLKWWQPFRRVVYLVRDGRAATFSNWQYQVAEGAYRGTFDEFVSTPHWPSTWSEHVTTWTSARETVLVVRYEDLVSDTVGQLERMVSVIGWSVERRRLEAIVANSTKEKMSALEASGTARLHRAGQTGAMDLEAAFAGARNKIFMSGVSPVASAYLSSR